VTTLWIGVGLFAIGIVTYWLLVATEGTYLGACCVERLYDWTAARYDTIKRVRFFDEQMYLGIPFALRLEGRQRPRILDVATGTARMPTALHESPGFEGTMVAGDRAVRMLAAAKKTTGHLRDHLTLLRFDAEHLPFADEVFDGATCLEALEFVPHGLLALREIHRILAPGGVVLLSNRVGWDALWFPGRIRGRGEVEQSVRALGFVDIETQRWQVHYDLVWARKPAAEKSLPDKRESMPRAGGDA